MSLSHFSPEQLQPIRDGVRTYMKLMGFIYSPELLEMRWLADEWDLCSSLDSLSRAVKASEDMIGKRKHQGVDYDVCKETKNLMETFLFSGRTEPETASLKKQNQPMYYLVITPILDLFKTPFDHATAIKSIDSIVEWTKELVNAGEHYGDLESAMIARFQVQKLIRDCEAKRLHEIQSRKRKPRAAKRNPFMELFMEVVEEEAMEA